MGIACNVGNILQRACSGGGEPEPEPNVCGTGVATNADAGGGDGWLTIVAAAPIADAPNGGFWTLQLDGVPMGTYFEHGPTPTLRGEFGFSADATTIIVSWWPQFGPDNTAAMQAIEGQTVTLCWEWIPA
jgi:hypothetical protein